MKKAFLLTLSTALLAPVVMLAQKDEKEEKDKKRTEQIIITRKGDKDEKIVIELKGDNVIVNGKSLDEFKDDDIVVRRNKIRDVFALGNLGTGWSDNFGLLELSENRALLGVTTEKADKGVEIKSITKESGAEKAGLKTGDIITKIDDKSIETPDDLSKAIKEYKPGDKVGVTYLREGKQQKLTAELGKWKGVSTFGFTNPGGQQHLYEYYNNIPDMNLSMPRIQSVPRVRGGVWNWSDGSPKLGLAVQDTEDGKGVKVIDADEEGNGAKAGIKEDDIITEVDGKTINSTDEIARIMKESKDKGSVKMKLLRNGKSQTVDVKIPRKLKTTDL